MKPRHLLLGAALLVAAALASFGDKTPQAIVAEPVVRAPAAPALARAPAPESDPTAQAAPAILRLAPREALLGAEGDRFGADGNEVFAHQDWTPPPPPPPPPPTPAPPPPPSAPPLPFTYIGKAVAQGAWEVYLARGDRTYLVREKTEIDGTYRVESIAPPILTLTYLPLNQVQQLNIGVFD
jgi:hypothetical protein